MTHQTKHAFCDDALGTDDATAIAAAVTQGDRTAADVTQAAVARAQATEASLHAVIIDRYETAVTEANAARATRGPFAGVPTFIKDMIDIAGMPTRFGSEALWRSTPAKRSDPLARQMEDMGMVCLGKSTMPEFGFAPSTEFPSGPATANPWNLGHTAGGSSGGAAALVAAGVVPIAHTADGGGSTRIPASCCGLVGLKPTRGRLIPSRSSARQVVGIVSDGVVTRSVRDTARYYAEAEARYHDPRLPRIGTVDRPLTKRLRIAAVSSTPGRGVVDAATQREFDATAALLESLGHTIIPFDAPFDPRFVEDFTVYWSLLAFAVANAGNRVVDPTLDPSALTDLTHGLARRLKRNALKVPGAIYRLRRSAREHARVFADVDVVFTPTLGQLTPPLGHLSPVHAYDTLFPRVEEWVSFTPYANATGAPSISLPLGFDEPSNLPVGMMFTGHHGQDRLLLELALELEEAQPWRRLG